MKQVHLFVPKFRTEEVLEQIRICLEKGWTGLGFKTLEFEQAWREYTGLPHAHFVNSATAGLHMAVKLLKEKYGWSEGDEIITTPFNTATPERAMKPTAADMDSGMPLIHSETMPPVHASGTPVNTISACWVDPNAANSMRKISSNATGTTTHKRWVAEIKCSKVPPQDIQ